jgi:hypothetical protein
LEFNPSGSKQKKVTIPSGKEFKRPSKAQLVNEKIRFQLTLERSNIYRKNHMVLFDPSGVVLVSPILFKPPATIWPKAPNVEVGTIIKKLLLHDFQVGGLMLMLQLNKIQTTSVVGKVRIKK